MDTKDTSLRVLMFPWLAHGHISPFLELAKKLSNRNLKIYLCSTPINLISIQKNLEDNNFSHKIHLIELNLTSLPNLPPHYHTTNGLPHHLISTLIRASEMACPNFSTILENLSPDLLIYDIFQSWVPALASSHCIPAVYFQISGLAAMSFFFHTKHRDVPFPFPEIYLREIEIKRLSVSAKSLEKDLNDNLRVYDSIEQSCDIILAKTCDEIEGKYIDYYSLLSKKKIVAVGSLVQDTDADEDEQNEIIQWLSKKDQSSTVFACFGSEYFLSKEQMEEIAHGLELSGVNFVWVIRFPVGERKEMEEVVPIGFLERTKERGVVVVGWAPQVKILGHPSVGGFLSHCGWGSTMESMKFGVPIIGMPMQLEQPLNARLAVEVGVGVEVMKDDNGEFTREELASVIKEVMMEKSGECVRKKAKDLSEKLRMKGEEEIDFVVEELAKLCQKNKHC